MIKKNLKFFVIPLLLSVFLLGTNTGTVLADEETEETPGTNFIEMVAENLGITAEQLQDAFTEARQEWRELDPEERSAEQFQAIIEEILNTEYGIEFGALETAIAEVRESIKEQWEAKREQYREQFEARKGEIQQQLEERKAQIRERLEAYKADHEEWLEGRKAQLRERLEAYKAELHEWYESHEGEIQAWKTRMQEWRESRKGELQERVETWKSRIQEWQQSQGNGSHGGNGQGQN
jgi:DNA repair exonuclease SbcCD ATPase subunit